MSDTTEAPTKSIKELKAEAIKALEDALTLSDSHDVRRKAAVDILNFDEKHKDTVLVTEEQLGWLGRVILETEEIRKRVEVSEK